MRRLDLAILLVVVAVYNVPQLVSGSVQYDALEVHYAAQRYLSDELHAGRVPFWTPFIFSGFPFLADLQVAAWYPLNWPFFLAGITPRSIDAEVALHVLIACVGAYLLAHELLRSGPAAVAAAVFYGCSGWFAAHAQHVGMVATAAWLPWLLLVLESLRTGVTVRKLALAGLLGAAIALPGSFQVALYTFSFVAIWAGVEAVAARRWTLAWQMAAGLASVAAWGALIAAVMILPAMELVARSERSRLSALALPDIGYFHLPSLATLVYPDVYGLLSGHYVGPGDSTQHYFYAGILLLPLVLIGVRNRRVLRMAASLSLPFLWYALGPAGGLYRAAARVPGFNSVELPMHGWFLVALGLALLGGAGMAQVARRIGCRWSLGLVAVIGADVLVVNQLLNPLASARQSVDALYGQQFARLDAEAAGVERLYGPELAAVGYRNHGLQSRVETTYGYNPLELSAYADYIAAVGHNPRLVAGLAASHELIDGRVQALADTLPRAYFARNVVGEEDLADLDPSTTTVVDGDMPSVAADPTATVSVESRGMDWLVLRYTSATPSLIRVAIPLYPGWAATLGGAPVEVVRVDGTFIGIVVPPGDGEVRLSYAPRVFLPGAAISVVALLAALAALLFRRRGAGLPQARPRPSPAA